jgi:hypothetical protein
LAGFITIMCGFRFSVHTAVVNPRNIAAELRDELLNGKIFYSLKEAQIVIEQWRKH